MSATACPVLDPPSVRPIAPPRSIRLRVEVTAADIARGTIGSHGTCPIALAAYRCLAPVGNVADLADVGVGSRRMVVDLDGVRYAGDLPREARWFVAGFDAGCHRGLNRLIARLAAQSVPRPFRFEIELSPAPDA